MSEYNDIAGSEDVISLNFETQETFNEHSYRIKQSANRNDKTLPLKEQAKENQKPNEEINLQENDGMQTDAQINEQPPPSSIDSQNTLTSNNPFSIRPQIAQSTMTFDNTQTSDKDLLIEPILIHEEKNSANDSTMKSKSDLNISGHDASTTTNNIRLYISPSTSLLETTNVDEQSSNPTNTSRNEIEQNKSEEEINDKPKEEPMDTSDAQVSLGSDGIVESTTATEQSPKQIKITISPKSKASYSLSQPTTDKFETILSKLTTPSKRETSSTIDIKEKEPNIITREEEELFIKESISKIIRRYAVKVDQNGRILSRDLVVERVVEENSTTRIESWPPLETKTNRRPTVKAIRKKPVKPSSPKRKTKSLKPTSTVVSSKTSKTTKSDDEENSKTKKNEDSSNSDDNDEDEDEDENENDDDQPTDDISGEEFIPTAAETSAQPLKKGLRIFSKWTDGRFYPGVIGNINGDKYTIDYDDGAKRSVKAHDIICQSYLEANQNVIVQTKDGYYQPAIIKSLIKKKKSNKLGYIVEKDKKEKWYPLRFISLTSEQAENLPIVKNDTEKSTNSGQGKRKRISNIPQSPNKKTKSSIFLSPNKNQRSTFTPTRQTKLFNTMYFLLTGFNDLMDVRHKIEESIESHGGKIIEKMPNASRRENVYLISDVARKTAKFLDAKKFSIPCVNYQWINDSIEKGEIQDWESQKLVLPEKETKTTNNRIIDDDED